MRKSLKQWNSTKDKLPFTKSNGFAIKPAPNPITAGKRTVAKGSVYSGRGNPAGKEPRANGTLTEPKIRSSTFGSRAKTSPTIPSTRISEAAINHGLRKYVDRAVEKDSLSNCSRQLVVETSGRASRLPRSSAVPKIQPKETRIRSVGKTDLELVKSTTKTLIKTEADTIPDSKVPKPRDAPIVSRMAASRVPLSRFSSRNLSTTKSTVKSAEDKTTKESVKVSKSSEKLSSSAPDNKSSVIKRSPTYQEKVLARPSAKSHNLNPRESAARNSSTVSFQTKLPRPRTPSIVPNLVTEFKLLHDKRKNEVSRCSKPSKFLDRVNVASTSKIPKSVSLSGVQGVNEKDEEIELKTIFEDTLVDKSSADDKTRKVLEPPAGSKVPRPVTTKLFPVRDTGRISSSRTPKTPRGPSKNTAMKGAKKTSTPPTMKSAGNLPESENVPESLEKEDEEDEVVIPIMNPEMCNAGSFATQYRKKSIPENTSPQEPVSGGRIAPWIDGHERAYLKGRAIGLRVASMARAAKEKSKVEFVKTSPKITTPISISRLDKSQEIVDIGVSVIEKVLAEEDPTIRSQSALRDRVPEYFNLDKNTKWNSRQWV